MQTCLADKRTKLTILTIKLTLTILSYNCMHVFGYAAKNVYLRIDKI